MLKLFLKKKFKNQIWVGFSLYHWEIFFSTLRTETTIPCMLRAHILHPQPSEWSCRGCLLNLYSTSVSWHSWVDSSHASQHREYYKQGNPKHLVLGKLFLTASSLGFLKKILKPGLGVYACNSSTQKVKAGEVQSQPGLPFVIKQNKAKVENWMR